MRKCAVLCAVLALVCMRPALAEMYVGIDSRSQEAEMELESASVDGVDVTAQWKPSYDEAIGRNSINAIRVGYIQEIGSDLSFDASIAIGSVRSSRAVQIVDPAAPADTYIDSGAFLDSGFYIDFGAGVRGAAGGMSYTGGMRIELCSIEEDTMTTTGWTQTTEVDQRNIVIEGTIGAGEEVRGFVGIGLNFYKGEETEASPGSSEVVEFKFDRPFVIFAGIESRGETVNAFAQVSIIGEKFLSTRAGVAVKF